MLDLVLAFYKDGTMRVQIDSKASHADKRFCLSAESDIPVQEQQLALNQIDDIEQLTEVDEENDKIVVRIQSEDGLQYKYTVTLSTFETTVEVEGETILVVNPIESQLGRLYVEQGRSLDHQCVSGFKANRHLSPWRWLSDMEDEAEELSDDGEIEESGKENPFNEASESEEEDS